MNGEYKHGSSTVQLADLMPLINERLESGQTVSFSPTGTSMLPLLRQGVDTVTLSPIKIPIKKYDIVFYKRIDGSYVLHRIVGVGKTFTCIGDNQFIAEDAIEPHQIIAVVSAFSRYKKECSVTNLGYLIYCRIWHHSRFFRRCLRAVCIRVKKIVNYK